MARLKLVVPVLCILILAAHFLRERSLAFMVVSIAGIPFLFIRKLWVVRATQLFFVLAGMEWVHTTLVLVTERKALGLPWMRMAVILSAVAVLTLGSALIVNRRGSNQRTGRISAPERS